MSVVHSRLLYGAQVWADSVQGVNKAENALLQAQRTAALRVARCYRTVSDIATLVLARMPPATLVAASRKRIAEAKRNGTPSTESEEMGVILRQWQELWDSTPKAAWTRRLIPDLEAWWRLGPRRVSFHMAQVLRGHGCFQKYLWTKARAQHPGCVHCPSDSDDVEHTIFVYPFWEDARTKLSQSLGRLPRPEDVASLVCKPRMDELPVDPTRRRRIIEAASKNASLFAEMVETIMGRKEDLERMRQVAQHSDKSFS
ncbi:PREDICTED: uncharacterized protein LOC107164675 [Diuraphis noxia]|uniref:uncharacterized protein LOC107164675 n=1 Tax=Diuraphis noxia TaxID=143948 RepID=UPI00076373EB|nr:PREDICTED: uncharacterized protein LOC107164675 [Diuraphis noxia]